MKLYDELVWRGLIKDMSSKELEQKCTKFKNLISQFNSGFSQMPNIEE